MLNPTLDIHGIDSNPGNRPVGRRRAGGSRTSLSAQLPNFRAFRSYASQIVAPTAYTAVAGMAAWYPLRRLRVPDQVGEDMSLFAAAVELSSTDNGAAGEVTSGLTAQAWGSVSGQGAAVVVGVNLPVMPSAWTTAPYYGPGVEYGAGLGTLSPDDQPEYPFEWGFPPGALVSDDVACQKHRETRSLMPALYPLRNGESLDVALVMNGDAVEDGAGNNQAFALDVRVTLYLMRSFIREEGE